MEPRISLITLGTSDLGRAVAFYSRLGFDRQGDHGLDVAFFQLGPIAFAIWDRAKLAEDSGVPDPGVASAGFTLAHNVRSPEEVDAVAEEVRAAGGTITREPGATFWGGYSAAFTDPDGHPWEVAHNPHWTIHPDGSISI